MRSGRTLRIRIVGVPLVMLFVLLAGCINPLGQPVIFQIEPQQAHVGDTITITAGGPYLLVYSATFDFGGATYEDPGYPWSSWEPMEGPLGDIAFYTITFEVPEGAVSSCVTLADGYHVKPGKDCYEFTVLDEEE